ncbi:MAG: ribonuclease P protein component [Candidatus Didemnitutus sp.]|nr:ribonuclease P protein component [Candidatus Didemnitutus sp.]
MSGADRPSPSQRLRASQRVKRNRDFIAARQHGRRADCGAFLLLWRARPEPAAATPARVGVVASRVSVGNAVARAAAKRRLREIYRKHQALVPAGLDLVMTARPALLRLDFADVERRFIDVCRKLRT